MTKEITNLLGLPFKTNLENILDHACIGCIFKEQAYAADEVTDFVGKVPEEHYAATEAFFNDQAQQRYSAIRKFLQDRKMDPNLAGKLLYLNGYGDQLRVVDDLRSERHPLVRAAYHLQLQRSLLMGTLVATMEQAEEEVEHVDREHAEQIIAWITEHAMDQGLTAELAAQIAIEGLPAVGGPARGEDAPKPNAVNERLREVASLSSDVREQGFSFLQMILDGVADPDKRAELQAKLDNLKENVTATADTNQTGVIEMRTPGEPTAKEIAQAIHGKIGAKLRINLPDLERAIAEQIKDGGAAGMHIIRIPRNKEA